VERLAAFCAHQASSSDNPARRTGRKEFLFKIEEDHDLTASFRKYVGTSTADRTGEFPE
jgi:hypothetical protein